MSIAYLIIAIASAAVTYALIALSQPLLRSYALARPNARSSHKVPTPQGGGIFVVIVTLGAGMLALEFGGAAAASSLAWTLAATFALAVVGAADDLLTLPAGPRLALQAIETAILFGLKEETVKTKLHRARALLKNSLEKQLGPALTETFPFDGRRCERMTEMVVRRLCT